MGGCCCCSSKGAELSGTQAYYYYPRPSEEHVPLSSHHAPASSLSGGLLVDTNLETSIPDTYRPPPAPLPFDVILRGTQNPPVAQEISGDKTGADLQSTNSSSVQEAVPENNHGTSDKLEDLKGTECKVQTDLELDSAKESEIELSKTVEAIVLAAEDEDVCPICLEEYDAENPKITTKCEHHFHLACILEWMERSEMCPVCDKDMVFDPPIDY
ncbi:E3 ubiquitin-protein ligase [Quillaja saponaria]|uniref:RING-type E3 ubiquitin transferase n=1 Tax=Quillaja saponaria TaxID=32244 RepID=A0AAD7KSP7_QUISA|nr:E3 ubiquitin-protein ligase [Quillaja saponaria]KAJ7944946.1 E3 ubiquitin-protein ligase [Quillaja saponaria]